MSESSTYRLRLPRSVKAAVEKLAREEGISMNQFVATAVAEKLAVMSTAAFFAERKGRGDEIAALPGMLARLQAARAPASARSKTARADAWSAAAPRMTAACEITASRIAFGSARAASASTSSSCSARAAARVAA